MNSLLGPPFPVTLNPKGEAFVTVPLPWAETLQEKLQAYGIFGDQAYAATSSDGEAAATLNFGTKADVAEIQRITDSFTIPPLAVVTSIV